MPEIGTVRLQKLKAEHVQALYARLLERGLSPRSVAYVHAILRRALKQARRWGLIQRNVTADADCPRPDSPPLRVLTPTEAAAFLEAARESRLHALFVVAVTAGLRQGELFGLRWQDVDLDAARLQVRFQLVRQDGTVRLVEPKTTAGRRGVDLSSMAVAALHTHRARQLEERLAAGGYWQNSEDLVFTATGGAPLRPSNLTRHVFRPLLKRAGLPQIRFHDLRHTSATLALAAGVHPKVVAERLGHTKVNFTLNTYSHVLPSMQRAAADQLDSLLVAAGGGQP